MRAALVGVSVVVGSLVAAPAAAQQAAPPGCTSEEHAQFDFWLGSWTVTNTAGATVGHNRIEKVSTGCALLESWTDARGVDGHSINFYDPDARAWQQVWMGSNGLPLRLQGHSDRPGRIIMTGTRPTAQGSVHNRITWTLQDDGSVEQVWDTSTDGGVTWQTGFHGVYRRE
jgi:hypothetical protein